MNHAFIELVTFLITFARSALTITTLTLAWTLARLGRCT